MTRSSGDPGEAVDWARKGKAFAAQGRSGEALSCFDRALAKNSQEASTWFGKGEVLFHLGRRAEAHHCLQTALELNPQCAVEWIRETVAKSPQPQPASAPRKLWPAAARLFRKRVSIDWLGETVADIDYITNQKVSTTLTECDVPTGILNQELAYIDTFLFEQAASQVFTVPKMQQRLLKAFMLRLVNRNLRKPLKPFQREYAKRLPQYLMEWSVPPSQDAFMWIASLAIMACGSTQYTLLMFFFTHARTSYNGALELLDERNKMYSLA